MVRGLVQPDLALRRIALLRRRDQRLDEQQAQRRQRLGGERRIGQRVPGGHGAALPRDAQSEQRQAVAALVQGLRTLQRLQLLQQRRQDTAPQRCGPLVRAVAIEPGLRSNLRIYEAFGKSNHIPTFYRMGKIQH